MNRLINEKCHDGSIDYYKITENIWQIEDENGVYCTLVIGEDKAILWDTGFGNRGIKPFIDRHIYTDLMVINSHGHIDHIGGNNAFEYVYAAETEMDLIFNSWNKLKTMPAEFLMRDLPLDSYIDLGGEKARVVDLKGHTSGSIGLLLSHSKVLLAGDAFNQRLWLFNEGAMNISYFKETAKRVLGLDFEYFIGGHHNGVYTKADIEALLKAADNISLDASVEKEMLGQKVFCYEAGDQLGKSILYDDRLIGDLDRIEISDKGEQKGSKKEAKKGILRKIFGKV